MKYEMNIRLKYEDKSPERGLAPLVKSSLQRGRDEAARRHVSGTRPAGRL